MTALVIAMFWAMTVQAQESQDSIESVNKAAIEREQNDARISSAEREQAQQEVKLVALQEVVIKGGLPNTRLKAGAMVTRIEGTPLAQSGTLGEMLIKVPGMTGSDETPEVLGKGSPLIYINGRKMRDASELKRLHSEDIRDVEVINAPGAQYDAQVRAVVRIRTQLSCPCCRYLWLYLLLPSGLSPVQHHRGHHQNEQGIPRDKARYDERTKVIADWFSEQEAVPGLKVNGQKTLGENVSDNGGLKIAYRAYKNRMVSEPLGDVDGFTPDQRFYLAYARSPADDRYLVRGFRHPAHRQDVYPQGEASISVVSAIGHRSTVYHTIRHKPLHNIPLMQGFLQLSVIL